MYVHVYGCVCECACAHAGVCMHVHVRACKRESVHVYQRHTVCVY